METIFCFINLGAAAMVVLQCAILNHRGLGLETKAADQFLVKVSVFCAHTAGGVGKHMLYRNEDPFFVVGNV